MFGCIKGFLWDPWVKGHTPSIAPDCFPEWLGQFPLPQAMNESFLLSSSRTLGIIYFSYFFPCPSI